MQVKAAEPESVGEVSRPRRTLQRKAILSVVLLVVVSSGLCGYLTTTISGRMLSRTMIRDVYLLADAASRAVAVQVRSNPQARPAELLDNMTLDSRVAFVVISDATGQPIARRIARPSAWSDYLLARDGGRHEAADVGRAVPITDASDQLLTHTEPIWQSALDEAGGEARALHGYVTVGMSDPQVAQLATTIRYTTFGIVCMVGLLSALPVVYLARRWSTPLRLMARSARRLARGETPEPIENNHDDEVGLLADAFNLMAEALARTQRDLVAANAELEKKVNQRTEALLLVNEHLEMQMRDKDEFIRAITHDLNAPLRNIAGMTRMVLKKHADTLPEEVRGKLERIDANVRNETEMLSDLLDLSRVRSQPGHDVPLETGKLVKQVVDSLDYELSAKGIAVSVATDMPVLIADRNRIRQVFQNLIENAMKYMPADARTRRITIGFETVDGQGEFYVSDTGKGIDPADHERVFQVFQRARRGNDQAVEGRGVGLASVKSIIESYGGRITLDPPADTPGATFRFTFAAQHLGQALQPSQTA